ncbi:MAG: DUF2127 domain-containing protein [Pseudomonadota bacterium]|nr:DUF2127 domain-containing protein [Pseudomonadota bacterium]
MAKRRYLTAHRLFILTLIAKGGLGLIQIATALALVAGLSDHLPGLVRWMFAAELAEDPNDFIARKLLTLTGNLQHSDLSFYKVYFASHGLLHLGIVAALIYGATWADIAAIAVLVGFVIYQVAEWFTVGGVTLVVLTLIDLAVIWLTVLEVRRKKALEA